MTVHTQIDEDALDRASLYALDCLRDAEAEEYEAHLAVCHACRQEVASLRRAVGDLSHLVPRVAPRPALKDRLLAGLTPRPARVPRAPHAPPPTPDAHPAAHDVQTWKRWAPDSASAPLVTVPRGTEGFEPTGVEGIEVRRLFVDAANDRTTMLVRMRPGTAYPPHRHGGVEECYVLEGDLLIGDLRMLAGDYQRAATSSVHGVQSTEGGCLLFIVSSLHDQLLDGASG